MVLSISVQKWDEARRFESNCRSRREELGPLPTHDDKLHWKRRALAVGGCMTLLLLSGCAERKVRAIPWATAVLVRPIPPVPHSNDRPGTVEPDPDLRVEPPPNGPRIFSVRPAPPRPHVNTPGATEQTAPGKSPVLVPQLSPHETAVAKEQVAESIALAERNMAAARGKKLSASQADVLSKIVGFIAEAREAGAEGDWARARNLAKKAQILAEDLGA